jgi:tetratricopeptide (TPR) repeat protein
MLGLSVLATLVVALALSWIDRGRINDPFAEQIREAEAHLENESYRQAIAVYSDIIEQDPTHVLAHWSRGVAYYDDEQYVAAIADYSWVIEQGETANEIIYLLRAEAYVANGQPELALADYETILASEADEELKAEAAAAAAKEQLQLP